jgi:hypothetical protein
VQKQTGHFRGTGGYKIGFSTQIVELIWNAALKKYINYLLLVAPCKDTFLYLHVNKQNRVFLVFIFI